jgi:hypothetical protein
MPGLVGATMRRDGTFSSLRGSISHQACGEDCPERPGLVTVKLFNLLMARLGPGLLSRGVVVRARDLSRWMTGRPKDFWTAVQKFKVNNRVIDVSVYEVGVPQTDAAVLLHVEKIM